MRHLLIALLAFPAAARAVDPTPYLPADTDVVLTVKPRQLAQTRLGQKVGPELLREFLRLTRPAAVLAEAAGVDPLKEVETITIGLNLDRIDPVRPFALFEGRFDLKKVRASADAYAKAHPAKLSAVTVGGKPAYKVTAGKPADAVYAAVIDGSRLVVAPSEEDLEGVFTAIARGRKPVISKELAALLATSRSSAPIFARGRLKGKLDGIKVADAKTQARVRAIEWATAAVTVNQDVSFTVTGGGPDLSFDLSDLRGSPNEAIQDALKGAGAMFPGLKPVTDLLNVTRVAPALRVVTVSGEVKGEAIEKALKK
jgi:hypothetical protein